MGDLLPSDQQFIKKLTDNVLLNLRNENFGVRELAQESGMSRSGLNRKLRRVTGKNINRFIRETRLRRAMELLQNDEVTAAEVAYKVGFSSPTYFNDCFHKFFGYPPGKVKKLKLEPGKDSSITHNVPGKADNISARKSRISSRLAIVLLLCIIVIAGFFTYQKIFMGNKFDKLISSDGRIIIAVMPFQNLTGDTLWNTWRDGIQTCLITSLSNFTEYLRVRQSESVSNLLQSKDLTNNAIITPAVARYISNKLDAAVFINGNIIKAGSAIRLSAQLYNTKSGNVLKPFELDGPEEMILQLIDSLRKEITNFLLITVFKKEVPVYYNNLISTTSPEAYRFFILGNNAYMKLRWAEAQKWLQQSIAIDSNFYYAISLLSTAYKNQNLWEDSKLWCQKAYEKKEMMPLQQKIWTDYIHALAFETPNEAIKYLKQLLEIDDEWLIPNSEIGFCYSFIYQYDKAITAFEKTLEIYDKLNVRPEIIYEYTTLGEAYHKTGQFKKEKQLYRRAEKDFPGDPMLVRRRAILSLSDRKMNDASKLLTEYKSIRKNDSWSEADINSSLASFYSEADMFNEAEVYYRKAILLDRENRGIRNKFAYFLIDKERNIYEGLELIDNVLVSDPENYDYLHTKGYGLFKKGNYLEALQILQKSWDLRVKESVYDHSAYLHLSQAKEVVAEKQ